MQHGVKRREHGEAHETTLEETAQASRLLAVYDSFERLHTQGESLVTFTAEWAEAMLDCTRQLLLLNPEHYTAWNGRKRALMTLETDRLAKDGDAFVRNELAFDVATLRANPKSYATWQHRRWFLGRYAMEQTQIAAIAVEELRLLEQLLNLDGRNFHGWNYRVWLAEWAQLSLVDEFDFTTRKIYQNFSNYSAWQRRAHLFPARLGETGSGGCEAMLRNEVEMCRNAAWTEPGDQSVWFYQRWLFGRLPALLGGEMQMLLTRLAGEQLNSMLELVAEEPSAALAISFVVFLLRLIGDTDARIPTLLARLATVDPTREAYWKTQVEK